MRPWRYSAVSLSSSIRLSRMKRWISSNCARLRPGFTSGPSGGGSIPFGIPAMAGRAAVPRFDAGAAFAPGRRPLALAAGFFFVAAGTRLEVDAPAVEGEGRLAHRLAQGRVGVDRL